MRAAAAEEAGAGSAPWSEGVIDWDWIGEEVVAAFAAAVIVERPGDLELQREADRALNAVIVARLVRRTRHVRDWIESVPKGAVVLDVASGADLDAIAANYGLTRGKTSALFDAETDLELRERVRAAALLGARA